MKVKFGLKLHESRPIIGDAIKNGVIQQVYQHHPIRKVGQRDGFCIWKGAVRYKVLYIIVTATTSVASKGIAAFKKEKSGIMSFQEFHADNQ